ncbi:hypothetical protein B5F10_08845 [Anaerotruncus colihominis]|uniref:Uncharacterized protein n=1 Tax=Anaerotruncus colihominis TaxID=169435 RepID=A0A1Y4MKR0_9FIRM|nr:hypothetical protein B5F11_09560 [Anaerotruncus colihominis]OUP74092.1 hypothetical protein B5F10_08845 [Anaerotruncus colihominis]
MPCCKTGRLYTTKGGIPIQHLSDIHYSILQLLAECGWVSQPLLELTGYSYTYRSRCLKTLLDSQYIRKRGQGRSKAYALTTGGRKVLASYNAQRYRKEILEASQKLTRHPERDVLRGDVAAILSLAGFSVHPDDKPVLPAPIPLSTSVLELDAWKAILSNEEWVAYPCEADQKQYCRKHTAIGCYYDAIALKEKMPEGNEGVNYSRACGVLVTPSHLLTVYHSRDVAMMLRMTGEQNFQSFLFSGQAFIGYRPEKRTALVFGSDFTAAIHIIKHHISGRDGSRFVSVRSGKTKNNYKTMKGGGELLRPGNLGNPTFYLPLWPESLTLLQMMHYPFWQERMISQITKDVFHLGCQVKWCFQQEEYTIYILAALNLTQIDAAFRSIRDQPGGKFRILCFHWQEPFFRELLEPYLPGREIWLTRLPEDYISLLLHDLSTYWRDAVENDSRTDFRTT